MPKDKKKLTKEEKLLEIKEKVDKKLAKLKGQYQMLCEVL